MVTGSGSIRLVFISVYGSNQADALEIAGPSPYIQSKTDLKRIAAIPGKIALHALLLNIKSRIEKVLFGPDVPNTRVNVATRS